MAESRKNKVHLKIPGETAYLSLARAIIVEVAEGVGFSGEEVVKIEMAVDEACNNIIEHSYAEGEDAELKREYLRRRREDVKRPIDLRVKADSKKIEISFTDQGKGFDVKSHELPEMDEGLAGMRRGGLGIYLIKKFMDEIDYNYRPGVGNILLLVKYLRKEKDTTKSQ